MTGSDRWKEISAPDAEALALPEPDRVPFVVRACGGDDDLRAQVKGPLAMEFAVGAGRIFCTLEDRRSNIWIADVAER